MPARPGRQGAGPTPVEADARNRQTSDMGQRMFVAVVPPEPVVEDLSAFLEPRRDQGMPWIDPAQWHVTLAFMESVPDRALDDLVERLKLAAARRHPMTLRLAGAGAFPDPARAKVVYLGLRDSSHPTGGDDLSELGRLATGVRAAASAAGAPVDGKDFRPHLSLARLKRPVEATRWLRILDTYDGPSWPVTRFELVASHLHEGHKRRPRHEVVASVPLGLQSV